MPKYLTIGRHPYTNRQKELLKKVGLEEEVARIVQVDNPTEVVALAKEKGAKAIVIQALPVQLVMQMLPVAQKEGVDVLRFRMETIATVDVNEPCPVGTELERVERGTNLKRCVRTAALERVKRIIVEAETVAE